ncbi:MAG: hypothetical protein JO240_12730 [Solirubrobacterales bacterium]|nr:hypothetical protein [Solirubrobacterales bacterium]
MPDHAFDRLTDRELVGIKLSTQVVRPGAVELRVLADRGVASPALGIGGLL